MLGNAFSKKGISAGGRQGAVLGATLLLCLTAMFAAAPAALSFSSRDPYIVVLKDDVAHPANVARRHEENRGAEVGHIYGVAIKGYSADLTPGEVKAIRQDPNVGYVERDGVIHPQSQLTGTQIKRVYANQNPQLDIDGVDDARVDVDIAILDTGVANHPDLNVFARTDCVGGKGCVDGGGPDVTGHGTHVAGDAAAIDNGIGAVGTAPGARIWSVRVISGTGPLGPDEIGNGLNGYAEGNSKMSDAIAGVNWVTAHSGEIEVANMSFDCTTDQGGCARTALAQAIATSVNSGVVWIAAAGYEDRDVNEKSFKSYPALLSDVITVSAMADYDGLPGSLSSPNACASEVGFPQKDDRLSNGDIEHYGSNYGPQVDITAPGTCIYSTWKEGQYAIQSGSSMAAGLVAGAAADIAAQYNPNSRADVEKIRAALLGAGNYNWEDLHRDLGGNLAFDGVKEPLLDLHTTPFWIPTLPPPPLPGVSIGSVTNITETSTVLTGTVNPQGHDGRFRFECGLLGAGYTIVPDPEGGYFEPLYSQVGVSGTIGGLTPGATYHCRMAAWNVGPLVYTGDITVTIPKMRSYVPPGAPAPLRQDNGNIDVFTRLYGVGDELDFTRATSGMWTSADLTPAGQPKIGASSAVLRMKNGAMHAFAINKSGDIICHYRTGSEPWNYINLSAYAGATMKFDSTTTPSAVEWGPDRVGVYARAVNGDLVSLERREDGTWFMWNESEHTNGHPTLASSPAAVALDNPAAYANTLLIVFARNASNQLISFNMNTIGEWTPYNVSEKTGVNINASPTAVQLDPAIYAGSGLGVYTTNANNDLLEFSRATSGAWTIYNVTQNIAGKPPLTGSVAPIRLTPDLYAGDVLAVYGRTTDNDLVGFDRQANGAWYFYNVSAYNGFPKISSSPSVLSLNSSQYFGSGLQVHARSTGNELLSFDRFMDGGWHVYNETANVPGHQKVE